MNNPAGLQQMQIINSTVMAHAQYEVSCYIVDPLNGMFFNESLCSVHLECRTFDFHKEKGNDI